MIIKPETFLEWKTKRITLLGMSGVGKTTLANKLSTCKWFHYSGDYRIGANYLRKAILKDLRNRAVAPASNSVDTELHITKDDLSAVTNYLGKIGDQSLGGLSVEAFKKRQALHRQAEIAAMKDVPDFIQKSMDTYGCRHFLNDAGGSLCELGSPETIDILAEHTVLVYIRTNQEMEQMLLERARKHPKPMYYREAFLNEKLSEFIALKGYSSPARMPPDEFVLWVFPELFRSRLPRYQAIADEFGYTVDAGDVARVRGETDFIGLIADAIAARR